MAFSREEAVSVRVLDLFLCGRNVIQTPSDRLQGCRFELNRNQQLLAVSRRVNQDATRTNSNKGGLRGNLALMGNNILSS